MDWSHIMTFAVMALVIEVSPGPNFLLIMKTVPTSGRYTAYANIAGFATAFLVHGALSIFGFAVILASSDSLFFTVKLLGASYLCFLGVQAVREARQRLSVPSAFVHTTVDIDLVGPSEPRFLGKPTSLRQGWLEGLIANCLNPKISLFYLAIFPNVIKASGDTTASSFLLVTIHIAVNAVWFTLVTVALERLVIFASNDRLVDILKAMSGFALIGFGATFAMSAGAHTH